MELSPHAAPCLSGRIVLYYYQNYVLLSICVTHTQELKLEPLCLGQAF